MYKNSIRKTVLKRQRVGNEVLLEALFHRQTVAHTQQNLTNYKIEKKRKKKKLMTVYMRTKIC